MADDARIKAGAFNDITGQTLVNKPLSEEDAKKLEVIFGEGGGMKYKTRSWDWSQDGEVGVCKKCRIKFKQPEDGKKEICKDCDHSN